VVAVNNADMVAEADMAAVVADMVEAEEPTAGEVVATAAVDTEEVDKEVMAVDRVVLAAAAVDTEAVVAVAEEAAVTALNDRFSSATSRTKRRKTN